MLVIKFYGGIIKPMQRNSNVNDVLDRILPVLEGGYRSSFIKKEENTKRLDNLYEEKKEVWGDHRGWTKRTIKDSKRIDANRVNILNIGKFLNDKFGDEAPKIIRSESLIPREDSTTAVERSKSDLTPYDAIQLERSFKSD